MLRIYRRLRIVLPGIIARLYLKLGIKKVPGCATCPNCEYGQNEYDCNPPGEIPNALYEKYDDDQLPKHCGFYKSEAINQ